MLLSVVIPAFNEEKALPACLASVRSAIEACQLSSECEVIVCDNNSTDRTAELAAAGGAKVVFEPQNQISRARNAGAAAAAGSWLLFIDADSLLDPRNLSRVAALARESGRVAGGGCVVAIDGLPWWARPTVAAWNAWSRLARVAAGSFVFCEAALFRAVGGFSLEFYAAEELDFSKRVKLAATAQNRTFTVLSGVPHVSSGRKFQKYSALQMTGYLARAIFGYRKLVRSKEQLDFFYDGRR